MSLSGLTDASHEPMPAEVSGLLGEAASRWERLIAGIAEKHAPVSEVWNHGGPKTGWTLRLKRKDRIIAYLIPQHGNFLVGLVLGERAHAAAGSLALPTTVRALIEAAPRYAEGRGFRVPVTTDEDAAAVLALVAEKMR